MDEFTKGEWEAKIYDDCAYIEVDGKSIAEIFGIGNEDTKAEANARLIAAAPGLYAACKAVEHELKLLKTRKLDVLPMVIAALAKVEKLKGD